MSTRRLRRSVLRPRRAALATGLGLLALGVAAGGYHVYENVPLLSFQGVCRDYQRSGFNGDVPHSVDKPLSKEFVRDLLHLLQTDQWRGDWFAERSGTVSITPRTYFASIEGKFREEAGGFRYYLSRDLVWDILQRRIAEGVIDERSAAEFYVRRGAYGEAISEPELMAPSECGFMEALTSEDGKFVRD